MNASVTRTGWPSAAVLAGFLAICFAVSAIGGMVTQTSVGTWYQTLARPGFTPPDWVFAPVWTALYGMMAVAGWRVWRCVGFHGGRAALAWFGLQLALNLLWSILFFGLIWIGDAFVEILVLWVAILVTTVSFFRIDRWAGWLMVPYLAWVAYAAALNGAIWQLN